MIEALLFSFSYNDTLMSSRKDLEAMIEYCSEKMFKISTITDFEVYSFVNYSSITEIPYDDKVKRLLIYYTGHSKENFLELPTGDIAMKMFFSQITKKYPNAQILSVFDSCKSSSFYLAYSLSDNGRFTLTEDPLYTGREMIHFSSAESDALSTSMSCFTKSFISILKSYESSLDRINKKLRISMRSERYIIDRKDQVPSISCSLRTLNRLWPWVYDVEVAFAGDYFLVNGLSRVSGTDHS